VPNSIASDLSGFSAFPVRQNRDCTAHRKEVRLVMSDDGSDGFNAMNIAMNECHAHTADDKTGRSE